MMAMLTSKDELFFKCALQTYKLEKSAETRKHLQEVLDSLKAKYGELHGCIPFKRKLIKRTVKRASSAASKVLADESCDEPGDDEQGHLATNMQVWIDNQKAFGRISEIKAGLIKQGLKKEDLVKYLKEETSAHERDKSITDHMRNLVMMVEKLYPDYKANVSTTRYLGLKTQIETIIEKYDIELQRVT
ncbi:uncharacterized protein LOC112556056 [Pomacea canaliculata]|uniref:uncharacterized protein LOC112556056 n=1 Tax=Pomacea canaliculata TaxID=400727 RepID=UPI000D728FB3|nr:uncharacterized protein LOC112556056 [Pomacea canaliculata]XP_025080466.1 uncharacterized protein LOC112556056 [Pomacea canaliculata]